MEWRTRKAPYQWQDPPILPQSLPYLLSHPNIQNILMVLPPSTGNGRKRATLCPLPAIRSKGNLKTSKQLYWCPDKYIKAFISVIQTFQLTWKDIMLLLDQILVSLEMQWVLTQATQVGNDYHLQWAPILVAPGKEGINAPTYRGTGSPLDRSTLEGADDMAQAVECRFAGIKSWVQAQDSQRKKYIYTWG
jgi:hypothetical protein